MQERERVEHVVRAAANAMGVTPEGIRSSQRTHDLSLARHIAAYILREDFYMTFTEVSIALGCLDASSARYGWLKIHDGEKPLATLLLPQVRAAASISVPMR